MGAELDGDAAQDQPQQHQHQRQVETAEDGGIDGRKGGEGNRPGGDEKDFIAVPDWPDAGEKRISLRLVVREQIPEPHAEVIAIQYGVADDQQGQEYKPDDLQCAHGFASSTAGAGGSSTPWLTARRR